MPGACVCCVCLCDLLRWLRRQECPSRERPLPPLPARLLYPRTCRVRSPRLPFSSRLSALAAAGAVVRLHALPKPPRPAGVARGALSAHTQRPCLPVAVLLPRLGFSYRALVLLRLVSPRLLAAAMNVCANKPSFIERGKLRFLIIDAVRLAGCESGRAG